MARAGSSLGLRVMLRHRAAGVKGRPEKTGKGGAGRGEAPARRRWRSLLSLGRDAEGLCERQTAVGLDPSPGEEREFLSRRMAGNFRLD